MKTLALVVGVAMLVTQTPNPAPRELLGVARPLTNTEIESVLSASRKALGAKTFRLASGNGNPVTEVEPRLLPFAHSVVEAQMRARLGTALTIAATLSGVAQPALAQDKPAAMVEALVGRSGFIDEVWDYFSTIGGGARVFVTPRLAIGPEVAYLRGEFEALHASNLTVTANMTFDVVRDDGRRRIVPYLVAGGGYLRQKTLVGSAPGSTALVPFTSTEGTMSAGVGARIGLGSHMFVAPEFRLGWEPETRIAVTIGTRFR